MKTIKRRQVREEDEVDDEGEGKRRERKQNRPVRHLSI